MRDFWVAPQSGLHGFFAKIVMAWLSFGLSAVAHAQRDPTVPPAVLGLPTDGASAAAPAALALQSGSVAVMQRDGVPLLVLGTRVYAQGQTVGISTIERITETEVWLRENGKLRKVPVFGGITRRAAPSPSATPAAPRTTPTPAADWPVGAEFEL